MPCRSAQTACCISFIFITVIEYSAEFIEKVTIQINDF